MIGLIVQIFAGLLCCALLMVLVIMIFGTPTAQDSLPAEAGRQAGFTDPRQASIRLMKREDVQAHLQAARERNKCR